MSWYDPTTWDAGDVVNAAFPVTTLANLPVGGTSGMMDQFGVGIGGKDANYDVSGQASRARAAVDQYAGQGQTAYDNISGYDARAPYAEAANAYRNQQLGGYDQQVASDYYRMQSEPVDQQMYAAARQAADAYARRGLGGSGMSAGAQGDVALQAAAQKRQARLAAIAQARGDKRQDDSAESARIANVMGAGAGGDKAYIAQQLAALQAAGVAPELQIQILNALASAQSGADQAAAARGSGIGSAVGAYLGGLG